MNGLIPFLWNMFTTHKTVRGQQECDFSIRGRMRRLYMRRQWHISTWNELMSFVMRQWHGSIRDVSSCDVNGTYLQPIPLGVTFSKAQSSKLERLFGHVSVKRDVRALSFETAFENVTLSGIGCTWNELMSFVMRQWHGSIRDVSTCDVKYTYLHGMSWCHL